MRNRMTKILIFMVLIGFVVAGCSDKDVSARDFFSGKSVKNPVLDKTVNRTIVKVDNLACGSCLTTISEKLNTIVGVVGMGANLSQAIVTVDHAKVLESSKIAEAITSIGYPAKIVSVTEIDSSKAFVTGTARPSGGGCCSAAGPANTTAETNDNGPFISAQDNSYSSGCGNAGSVRSRGCYASSASWKELVQRFSDKSNKLTEAE